jgi:ribose 5-phosphate isomerase A
MGAAGILDEAPPIGFIPLMNTTPTDSDLLKHAAAARALNDVRGGMKLGLGSGSTSEIFIQQLGAKVKAGLDVIGVPTSERVASLAASLGIRLGALDDLAPLDLAIDGADEATRALELVKGGGGALLREKLVASSAKAFVVMIHEEKLVEKLGGFPLPLEVIEFGHVGTAARIAATVTGLGYGAVPLTLRRKNGAVYKTDSGNVIYDAAFGPAIAETEKLATALSCIPGVVEHGLYVGIASTLIVARPSGIELITRT